MAWQPPVISSRPVAVLGAGVLGRRIACTFVSGGYNVHIRDPSAEARQAAIQYIDENKIPYQQNLPKTTGIVVPGSYSASEDIETAVKEAWLVIEAVPEKIELKIDTFAELDAKAPADCILGSNSSSFKSSLMLAKVANPDRRRLICNVHYTMPPNIRTVELMTDGETDPAVFPFLSDVLTRCGMLPATARKESTGFIFNRLWAAIKREILMILAEGVSDIAEVDRLWEHMFKAEVLPGKLMDQVGLDTVAFIEDNYINERRLDPTLTVDWLRENYINKGRLGLKSGDAGGLYPSVAPVPAKPTEPTLYFLDVGLGGNLDKMEHVSTNGKIIRRNGDTGKVETLVTGLPAPDGIDIAPSTGRMYWTNMGAHPSARDGSVMSAKLDGTDVQVVIPPGGVFTPKQAIVIGEKLYFCDREGMGVHRVGLDGQDHEVLVQRSSPSDNVADLVSIPSWCVGITVDEKRGKIYWTQKGPSKSNSGRIFRAGIDIPAGEKAATRSDIEPVFEHLPEPIDLEIDAETETLYWTDRGEHPRGSSLNTAFVGKLKSRPEILARHFHEPIGLKLDLSRGRVFVTDLGGSVYIVDVETRKKEVLFTDDGSYTGICFLG
ncbi:hypothetical protein QBC35DRAFT_77161 [Podospora australis]|uniref:Dehydrogenase n=1 Tax=Podospora australis TaxID=1536484 RepID=A0AAN7AFH7_9PEZI|nr:hypothetical protein QBC35DRAFT_77161 [Podospora australis]